MGTAVSRKVLLADDEPALREVLGAFLREEGFEVLEAADGREAMALLHSERPAALLLDLMMPQMSGWEVLDALEQSPAWRDIPCLVLTACIPDASLHGRVDAIFEKPFDVEALALALDRSMTGATVRPRRPCRPARPAGAERAPR
jgi:CheY-like chemotaxis protein